MATGNGITCGALVGWKFTLRKVDFLFQAA